MNTPSALQEVALESFDGLWSDAPMPKRIITDRIILNLNQSQAETIRDLLMPDIELAKTELVERKDKPTMFIEDHIAHLEGITKQIEAQIAKLDESERSGEVE